MVELPRIREMFFVRTRRDNFKPLTWSTKELVGFEYMVIRTANVTAHLRSEPALGREIPDVVCMAPPALPTRSRLQRTRVGEASAQPGRAGAAGGQRAGRGSVSCRDRLAAQAAALIVIFLNFYFMKNSICFIV